MAANIGDKRNTWRRHKTHFELSKLSKLSEHIARRSVFVNITTATKMDLPTLPDISKLAMTTSTPVPNGHDCAHCHSYGNMACKGCLLVVYCGRECQVADWKDHKKHCKSPVASKNWQPAWILEGRKRVWVDGQPQKFFWGNVPALDIVRLASNEGVNCKHNLDLLFAASGDLRNVVNSVNSLPMEYRGSVSCAINDRDFEVVARNIIICLIALTTPEEDAIDCMLHIWYSTLITQKHADFISTRVRPLISDVVSKISGKAADMVQAKTWNFASSSCRVQLLKKEWDALMTYLEVPNNLSAARALEMRKQYYNTAHYRDSQECRLFSQQPRHRVADMRLQEDGLLLPFASDRKSFTVPNPTLFQCAQWPIRVEATPFAGWSLQDVMAQPSGPATNDVVGKLYNHIRRNFSHFHYRINAESTTFRFLHLDAIELSTHLDSEYFDRIDVSNICDKLHLGAPKTVACMTPLLKPRDLNPHATLIMYFMSAVEENYRLLQTSSAKEGLSWPAYNARAKILGIDFEAEARQLSRYVPNSLIAASVFRPQSGLGYLIWKFFRDLDEAFDQYMARSGFSDIPFNSMLAGKGGIAMKTKHTIVDKWPSRLKLKYGQPGAQEEFDLLVSSEVWGVERYVEWERVEDELAISDFVDLADLDFDCD